LNWKFDENQTKNLQKSSTKVPQVLFEIIASTNVEVSLISNKTFTSTGSKQYKSISAAADWRQYSSSEQVIRSAHASDLGRCFDSASKGIMICPCSSKIRNEKQHVSRRFIVVEDEDKTIVFACAQLAKALVRAD